MKQIILKVCMLLMVVMVTVSCGNGSGKGESSKEGTKTEASATSKSAKVKKAKKSKNKDIRTAGRRKKKSVLTPTSAGAPYEVLLVAAEDDFHNGAVDSLYAILTDDMAGGNSGQRER